jgi:hypothetical protein
LGVACVLAPSAFADEDSLRQVALDLAAIFAEVDARPLDNERLEGLRGRLSGPTSLNAGVVLWDEPRKGAPPQPGRSESPPPSGMTGGVTILR